MGIKKQLSEEIYKKIDYAKSIASVEPEKSISLSKEAYELAKNNKLELEEAYALISMAFSSRVKTDVRSMLDYSYNALEIFKKENHIKGQGAALNLIGIAHFYGSIYEEALQYFLEAADAIKSDNEYLLKVSILNNIGEVYRETEIYDNALEYYKSAIDNLKYKEHPEIHGSILGNIGQIYFNKNEFSKALQVYVESYNILVNSSDMVSLGEVEDKIGKTYTELGDFKSAEWYYLKSLKRLEGINNKYYLIDTLLDLGCLYTQKSFDKGLMYFEKAIELSKNLGSRKKLCKAYGLVSNYYEEQKNYKDALQYYKKQANINEEIISLNLKRKLEILNIDVMNLEATDKAHKIRTRLKNEITRQKNEIEKIKKSNEELQEKAYKDELTGLKNRRSINSYIEKMLLGSLEEKDMVALFMIDIDHFKGYNDYWGHPEGDICIKRISDCIKRIQVSRGDTFGRYGGEEFVYISNSINYEEALKLGNLIRREVENMDIHYIYKRQRKTTTISVGGVIGHSSDFASMAEIMRLADKELYRAKDLGRNKTILRAINITEAKYNEEKAVLY